MKFWCMTLEQFEAASFEQAAELCAASLRSKPRLRIRVQDESFEPLAAVVIGADGTVVKVDRQS